jgi:uncharacterized protein YjbJ (UPF0337 family)
MTTRALDDGDDARGLGTPLAALHEWCDWHATVSDIIEVSTTPVRRDLMNKDTMQGKWREMKGKVKEQWGKLTDDDLDTIEGKSEQLLGLLQQRYGYARERAEEEYKRFMQKYPDEPDAERVRHADTRR